MLVAIPQSILTSIGTQIDRLIGATTDWHNHATEKFIRSLVLEFLIQSVFVVKTYHVSEHTKISCPLFHVA